MTPVHPRQGEGLAEEATWAEREPAAALAEAIDHTERRLSEVQPTALSVRLSPWRVRLILSRLAVLEEERRLDGESLKQADVALANVTAFEDDARYIMGNTNFEITKHCRDEIRARLQARKDHA